MGLHDFASLFDQQAAGLAVSILSCPLTSKIVRYLIKFQSDVSPTSAATQLQPWLENVKKRQVKAPKICLSDSGLLHALLGLTSYRDLEGHPKVGASWEGFLLQQIIRRIGARPTECFFWATHAGAELDLLVVRGKSEWVLSSSSPAPRRRHRRCASQ